MMMLISFFCASAVAALLFAEYRDNTRLKWLAKPAASASFIAVAVLSGALGSSFCQLVLVGLVFCFAGDVFLISRAPRAFLIGMGAFALGHLAYIGAFTAIGTPLTSMTTIPVILMGLMVFLSLRWLWPNLGSFRYPVTIYSLIIGVMVIASIQTGAPSSASPYWPVALGAVGFAISDIAVARDQFVRREFFNRLWGLPLYYAAQMLLAASVAR